MVLPDVQLSKSHPTADHQQAMLQVSPGQMLTHYSPTAPTFLFEGNTEKMRQAILAEVGHRQAKGEHVGILITEEDLPVFQDSGAEIYVLGNSLEQAAMHLFTGLRKLEETGVHVILCRNFEAQGLGLAIRDRLRKAAGGKVIRVE
jgi:L-threonylcarbamoyladenylate synthase